MFEVLNQEHCNDKNHLHINTQRTKCRKFDTSAQGRIFCSKRLSNDFFSFCRAFFFSACVLIFETSLYTPTRAIITKYYSSTKKHSIAAMTDHITLHWNNKTQINSPTTATQSRDVQLNLHKQCLHSLSWNRH